MMIDSTPEFPVTVFTSIVGSRDILRENQQTAGAKFVAFVDRHWNSETWEERLAYCKFSSPRRNSRVPKILAHQFVNQKYSIWLDGNVALLVPAKQLIEEYLPDADLAVFSHHARRCAYQEAAVCSARRLDDPGLISEQIAKYEDDGFPKDVGLGECTVIIRRHTPEIEIFNNWWWSEYTRYSARDQISFMYSVYKCKLKVKFIVPNKHANSYFSINHRAAGSEP